MYKALKQLTAVFVTRKQTTCIKIYINNNDPITFV